jgi:hypothetical protein
MRYYSKEEVRAKFYRYVRVNYDSQKEAAKNYGVVPSAVSMACSGAQALNSDMLADIGLERVVRYVKAKG